MELGPILNRPVFVLNKLSNDHLVRKLKFVIEASFQIYSHCIFFTSIFKQKAKFGKVKQLQ
jgi:hypothetical protein